ncbi:MAG: type III pantothenate kinase [bacterium]
MPGIILLVAGNTNCRLALAKGSLVLAVRTLSTGRALADPAGLLAGIEARDAALASVVPGATRPLARGLSRLTNRAPLVISTRTLTSLRIRYERSTLGADRLCVAEGARAHWPGDLAVADFGTAVTLNFVSAAGVFEGGPIMPGPDLMLTALGRGTARLPVAGLRSPSGLFPRTTRSALSAGALAAVAGGVTHAVEQVCRRTGRNWRLVGTGGRAPLMSRHLPQLTAIDPLLACRGLHQLYLRNRGG